MSGAAHLQSLSISLSEQDTSALERCFSPEQIAELWALSVDTVRRIFEHESGVLVIERPRIRSKRHYRTLRIPESVAQRVYHRLSMKGKPTC